MIINQNEGQNNNTQAIKYCLENVAKLKKFGKTARSQNYINKELKSGLNWRNS